MSVRLISRALLLVLLVAVALTGVVAPVRAAGSATVGGRVFFDDDRDGFQDATEQPIASHTLYLLDAAGPTFVASTTTAADGTYRFDGVASGTTYVVQSSQASWESLRADWVPTTTGGQLRPRRTVTVDEPTETLDFGWRRIVRSTTVGRPISSFVAPSGLTVESYDDVLNAQGIYDNLTLGTLVGDEGASIVIRSGLGSSSSTTTSTTVVDGRHSDYAAVVGIAYASWLDTGDRVLFHEYGHAWSMFYACIVQQDPSMAGYLEQRGLAGDPRVDTSYGWSSREMIAEDYRQLFGSENARFGGQMNTEIPPAKDVPGLEAYLRDAFRTAPSAGEPAPAPAPTPAPLEIRSVGMNPNPVDRSGVASFSLSEGATVTAQIIRSGKVVRTLAAAVTVGAGSSSLSWDRKDDAGRRVKAGSYSVVVRASASDGRQATGSAPFSVV